MTQLYDYAGRPITPPSRPETREIAAVSIRDRWSSYPSRGLTPGRLAQILYAADAGDLRSQAELFEEMEEKDPHLRSIMGTRRLAVLGLEWQVEDASDSPEDKKIAEAVRKWLENLKLKVLFTHLLEAIGHGYAAAEPVWNTGGAPWTIGRFNEIHCKNISFGNSLVPLVITEDNAAGVEPASFQLIWHRAAGKSGHDTRNGILRVCAYMYLFKNYALKDWAAFNEIFGMPLRLGKYEPSATPADREALRLAIASLGSDAAGIISKSTEIEFVEAASRLSGTTNPYEVMANFCNREMSKAVLGQTLTTDTQGSSGGLGGGGVGKVQAEVRQDLLEADAEMLSETIREQVIRPLVGFNFGWDKPIPGFGLLIQDSPDLKVDSEMVGNLVKAGAGKRIPAKWVNEHFGIPEPKDDEEVLGAAAGQIPPTPPLEKGGVPAAMRAVLTLKDEAGREYHFDDNGVAVLGALPQDKQVIAIHQDLEKLTQDALAVSAQVVLDALKPVWDLIEANKSLEDIKRGLLIVYPDIHPQGLGNLLYQAGILAWMKGRMQPQG